MIFLLDEINSLCVSFELPDSDKEFSKEDEIELFSSESDRLELVELYTYSEELLSPHVDIVIDKKTKIAIALNMSFLLFIS